MLVFIVITFCVWKTQRSDLFLGVSNAVLECNNVTASKLTRGHWVPASFSVTYFFLAAGGGQQKQIHERYAALKITAQTHTHTRDFHLIKIPSGGWMSPLSKLLSCPPDCIQHSNQTLQVFGDVNHIGPNHLKTRADWACVYLCSGIFPT